MLGNLAVTPLWSRHPDTGAITCIAFHPQAKAMVTSSLISGLSGQATLSSWDVADGRERGPLAVQPASVNAVAFNPRGTLLASAGDDSFIHLREAATGTEQRRLSGHRDAVRAVAFSPDGETIASAGDDTRILLWRVSTGQLLHTLIGHGDVVTSLAWSLSGNILASGSRDATVRLWNPSIGREMYHVRSDGPVNAIAFSPDGQFIASGGGDEAITIWGVVTAQTSLTRATTLTRKIDTVTSLAFHPKGRLLAGGILRAEEPIELWDVQSGHLLAMPGGHTDEVYSLAFGADGCYLACGGGGLDTTIEIFLVDI